MFGFILSGLSSCSGMPVVNTYVLLFPLISLNILSFYALISEAFQMDKEVATIATIIYGFTGGLGYIFQVLIYGGTIDFWSVSHLTYDMYFTVSFWNNIEFSFKSLALTLVYSSMVIFVLSTRFKALLRKSIGFVIASLLLLFSFSIHIVEPLILSPAILVLAFLYEERWLHRLANLGSLILGIAGVFLLIDYLTNGYYLWLVFEKFEPLFSTLNIAAIYLHVSYALILIPMGMVISQRLSEGLRKTSNHKKANANVKKLVVVVLVAIYLAGLYCWLNAPTSEKPLYDVNQFPWYYHTTRYGFVGFLALVGVGFAGWKAKRFLTAIIWCLAPLFIGSFWWGYRLTSYVYPMVAFFAAISLSAVWKKSNFLLCTYLTDQNTALPNKVFRIKLKPVLSISIATVLVLASSSVNARAVIVAVRLQSATSAPSIVIEPLCVLAAKVEPGCRGADNWTFLSYFALQQLPILMQQPNMVVRKHSKKNSDTFVR